MNGSSSSVAGPFVRFAADSGVLRRLPDICLAAALVVGSSGCSTWYPLHAGEHSKPQSSVEKSPTVITPPPSQSPAPRRHIVREPPHEPPREPERVASIDPKNLIGLAPSAVEKLLGAPSTVSKADPSLVWTYSGQGCQFQIIFYPDLKTAAFHALKYGSTGGDTSDVCVRNILTVKNNGPG